MGQFYPYFENIPLEDQIKTLGDDELLDFWEETQFLDKFLGEEQAPPPVQSWEYERVILQELQLRSCLGRLEAK